MDMMDLKEIFDKKNVFAVVGVSRNTEKWGFKVFKMLKDNGYTVYPINPHIDEIEGERCFPSLSALPIRPDVVSIVVPPHVTEEVVKECKLLGVKNVWMQPGSESETAIKFCKVNGINVIYGMCMIMERQKL